MPTYEFTCPNGHDFEKFFRTISSGESELPCPTCGAIAARKISAGAGLMFKGSGFYITDYGKDGKKDQSSSRKSAGNGEGAPASTSAEGGGGDATPASDAKPAEPKSSTSAAPSSASAAASKPAEPKPSAPKSSKPSE